MDPFLEGLDESLLLVKNISAALLSELRELPISGLRLRIVCRTADWLPTLEEGLRSLWGKERVAALEIVPLRHRDAMLAPVTAGVPDPEALLEEIRARGAVPFAAGRVTPRFLFNLHLNAKRLPRNRVEMYREGC